MEEVVEKELLVELLVEKGEVEEWPVEGKLVVEGLV